MTVSIASPSVGRRRARITIASSAGHLLVSATLTACAHFLCACRIVIIFSFLAVDDACCPHALPFKHLPCKRLHPKTATSCQAVFTYSWPHVFLQSCLPMRTEVRGVMRVCRFRLVPIPGQSMLSERVITRARHVKRAFDVVHLQGGHRLLLSSADLHRLPPPTERPGLITEDISGGAETVRAAVPSIVLDFPAARCSERTSVRETLYVRHHVCRIACRSE